MLLLSSIFFASAIICTDQVRAYIPNFTLNSMRFLLGGIFLCLLGRGIPTKLLKKSDVLWSLLRGCLGITFYYILETFSLKFISVQMVSILVGLAFIFSVSYEALKREIKITKQLMVVIGLNLMGMILVAWVDLIKVSFSHLIAGISLMIAANISWVIYVRLEKTKSPHLSALQGVGLDMVLGALGIFPGAIFEMLITCDLLEIPQHLLQRLWYDAEISVVIQLLYLAVFPSAIAYYLYNKAIEIMPSSICSIYLNIIPILSILILEITSKNTLALYEWVGVVQIGLCVIYINYYYEKQKIK